MADPRKFWKEFAQHLRGVGGTLNPKLCLAVGLLGIERESSGLKSLQVLWFRVWEFGRCEDYKEFRVGV